LIFLKSVGVTIFNRYPKTGHQCEELKLKAGNIKRIYEVSHPEEFQLRSRFAQADEIPEPSRLFIGTALINWCPSMFFLAIIPT
jgi:hypothetical protein